jgi:antitoxin (DNA-binding transcriptional repressor) of toxin-antitoxin stability system
MPGTKVGIREFRANLASILEAKTPVTRHGETLGVFVPVGARPKSANLPRSTKPTTAEELIADFEKARREKRALRTQI